MYWKTTKGDVLLNTWDNIMSRWEYVLPPSRPSSQELDRIKSCLIHYNKDEPVGVLGSTIEYRDLLYELGFLKIFVFENNIHYYASLNEWKVYPIDRENIVCGDWINTISEYKGFFNVLLSDLTMGNISYDKRDSFFGSIYESLKENGLFIDKVLTNELELITLNDIEKKYSSTIVNLRTVNNFSCEALFCSELLKCEIVDTSHFYDTLRRRFRNNNRLMRFIDKAHLITPEDCIWYYGKDWSHLKNSYFSLYQESKLYEDEITSPYFGRLKHIINYKKGVMI